MGIIIRQSIKATAINYVGTFIGFLTTMFIAVKFLPKEELGLVTVILNAGLLFCSFAQLGIGSSAIRFFPYFNDKDKNNNGFFFYLMLIPSVGMILLSLIFLFLKNPVSAYFEANSELFVDYYYWVIPLGGFLLYAVAFETYSSILLRIAVPKLIKEILLRLLVVVVYLLYGFKLISLTQFVACYVGVYGIITLAIFYYVSRIGPVNLKHNYSFVDKGLKRSFYSYTSLIVIGSLGGTLVSKLDTFMVSSNLGLGYAAIYAIAANMAAVIEMPSRSITAISSPLAADALQKGDFQRANNLYKQVSLHQLIAGSIIFLLIWINMDNIYAIIPNGNEYKAGKWVVFFIGMSKIVEITLGFGGALISFSRYYHWSIYFTFFITALTIFSNNLLIPIYGVTGAAIATALTCLVSYTVQQWIIFIKIKGNPYSVGTAKQIALVLLLYALNLLLPQLANPWFDGIYRTFIICFTGLPLLYLLKVSADINRIVKRYAIDPLFRKK